MRPGRGGPLGVAVAADAAARCYHTCYRGLISCVCSQPERRGAYVPAAAVAAAAISPPSMYDILVSSLTSHTYAQQSLQKRNRGPFVRLFHQQGRAIIRIKKVISEESEKLDGNYVVSDICNSFSHIRSHEWNGLTLYVVSCWPVARFSAPTDCMCSVCSSNRVIDISLCGELIGQARFDWDLSSVFCSFGHSVTGPPRLYNTTDGNHREAFHSRVLSPPPPPSSLQTIDNASSMVRERMPAES